jgi:hypothetical protein
MPSRQTPRPTPEDLDGKCRGIPPIRQDCKKQVLRLRSLRRTLLPMNGPVECRAIPPIRQKKGEWMGHGSFGGRASAGSSLDLARLLPVRLLLIPAMRHSTPERYNPL